jgi:hypothetical protein
VDSGWSVRHRKLPERPAGRRSSILGRACQTEEHGNGGPKQVSSSAEKVEQSIRCKISRIV